MTESVTPPAVELLDAGRLRLTELPLPALPPEEEQAMERAWAAAVRANPHLFDGPAATCLDLAPDGAGDLLLSWARTTYRRRALHGVPGAAAAAGTLYVSVLQAADDGRLLVGRMAGWTSAPGRWLLPGGTVEPPGPAETLDAEALRRHAARELAEETGLEAAPRQLDRRLVVRSANGDVGVLFLAPPRPARHLIERHAALAAAERAVGREPELDRVALVAGASELARLGGPFADYLEPVLRRYPVGGPSARVTVPGPGPAGS